MRLSALVGVLFVAAVSAACSNCPKPASSPCLAGAAPERHSAVYTPPCDGGNYARPEGDKVYTESTCGDFFESFIAMFQEAKWPWSDCSEPMGFAPDCAPPAAAPCFAAPPPCAPPPAASPCAPPQMAASSAGHCGPMPAEAKPGEVWCCVFVQPPAAPPVSVCVAPESCYDEPVPGVYHEVTESVCITPASCYDEPVPGVYREVAEPVCLAPSRVEWQRVACEDGADKECWSLVTVPAVMGTKTRTVCDQPPSTRKVQVPAVMGTQKRTVCETPPSTRKVTIPARYEMRASAPPPGFWQWQRDTNCEAPAFQAPAPAAAPAATQPTGSDTGAPK